MSGRILSGLDRSPRQKLKQLIGLQSADDIRRHIAGDPRTNADFAPSYQELLSLISKQDETIKSVFAELEASQTEVNHLGSEIDASVNNTNSLFDQLKFKYLGKQASNCIPSSNEEDINKGSLGTSHDYGVFHCPKCRQTGSKIYDLEEKLETSTQRCQYLESTIIPKMESREADAISKVRHSVNLSEIYRSKNSELANRLAQVTAECTKLNQDIEKQSGDYVQSLEHSLKHIRDQHKTEVDSEKQSLDVLKKSEATLKAEKERLEESLAIALEECNSLREQLIASSAEKALSDESIQVMERLRSAQATIARLEDELRNMERSTRNDQVILKNQNIRLDRTVIELEATLRSLETERTDLKENIVVLNEKFNATSRKETLLKSQNDQLESKLKHAEAMSRAQTSHHEAQLESRSADLRMRYDAFISTQQSLIHRLRSELQIVNQCLEERKEIGNIKMSHQPRKSKIDHAVANHRHQSGKMCDCGCVEKSRRKRSHRRSNSVANVELYDRYRTAKKALGVNANQVHQILEIVGDRPR